MFSGDGGGSNSGGNDEPSKIGTDGFSRFRSLTWRDWNEARARTGAQNIVSEHGASRAVPHGGPEFRDCIGSERGAGIDIGRRKDYGPWRSEERRVGKECRSRW